MRAHGLKKFSAGTEKFSAGSACTSLSSASRGVLSAASATTAALAHAAFHLAGAELTADVVARVAPAAITVVKQASYVKHTRFGPVGIRWTYNAGTFSTTLSVPPGATVDVHTPTRLANDGSGLELRSLRESGLQLLLGDSGAVEVGGDAGILGAARHGEDGGSATSVVVTTVSSGEYHFHAQYA